MNEYEDRNNNAAQDCGSKKYIMSLCCDTGSGFSDPEKLESSVAAGEDGGFSAEFSLGDTPVRALRFSPAAGEYVRCVVDSASAGGAPLALRCMNENQLLRNGFIEIYSVDPYYLSDQTDIKSGKVVISGRIEPLPLDHIEKFWSIKMEEANSKLEALGRTLDDREFELADIRKADAELKMELRGITSSKSWNITKPLRYAVRNFRNFVRRIPGMRPLYRLLKYIRRNGFSTTAARVHKHIYEKRFCRAHFTGKSIDVTDFATPELLGRQFREQPSDIKISVVVPLYNTPADLLEQMIDSVVDQSYQNWELCLADASTQDAPGEYAMRRARSEPRIKYKKLEKNEGIAGNTNRGFEMTTGDYISLLDHDDILHPSALWYVAQAVAKQGADFIYTDEVTFEGTTKNLTVYHFKPDFAIDNLRSCNYICHLTTLSRALLEQCGGERGEYNGSQDYDFVLRLTEKAKNIVHIPHLLYYWRATAASVAKSIEAKPYCITSAIKALDAHYERLGLNAHVSMVPKTPGFYKTDYAIDASPLISILIPNMDSVPELDKCIRSIYQKSTYRNFEIIIIENNSKAVKTFEYYDKLKREHPDSLSVVNWDGEGFNYSALNNFGASKAKGEYLLLLNNDVEVITPDWIERMLMYAQQKRVGCVGAKLLYPDGTIQHAGIGIGFLGIAAHMHRGFPFEHPGYMCRLVIAQDVAAVTGACLMLRREVFDKVGGFDELFAVAFNDVDFCLRVWKAGYQNIFTPYAELYHYESKSRGLDNTSKKRRRFIHEIRSFQHRWNDLLVSGDPFYNPNFDHNTEDLSFDIKPLI
jgi:GT2 family glycosyltransferase